jgi:hypothetical protein
MINTTLTLLTIARCSIVRDWVALMLFKYKCQLGRIVLKIITAPPLLFVSLSDYDVLLNNPIDQ